MKANLILTLLFSISVLLGAGQEVKFYNKANSNIVDDDLLSVAIDKKGNKWIGTAKVGLLMFDGEKFTNFNKDNSVIKGDYISPIFVDSKGNVWVSFSDPVDGIARYNGRTWNIYSAKDLHVKDISVISICEDDKGTLYFGGSNGVHIYQNDAWTTLKIPGKNIIIRAIDVNNNGAIAIGHNDGLLLFNDGKWKEYTEKKSELLLSVVRAVKYNDNGDLIVGYGGGFGNGGFSILSNKQWTHYNKVNSKVPDHMVRDIELDGKNYWMATNNGAVLFNETEIKPILFREGSFTNVILDIAIENGIIWLATNFGVIKYLP